MSMYCWCMGPWVLTWYMMYWWCMGPWVLTWYIVLVVYGPMGAYLVHDVLVVYGLQYLCLNGSVQVNVHELKHEVDVLVIVRLYHIQQLNYILMGGESLVCVCVCVCACACVRVCVHASMRVCVCV